MTARKLTITTFILIFILTGCRERPKVLIIGDSISLGYTPFVKESLSDKFIVFHSQGNAQHTRTGIDSIRKWVGNNHWDIIQFNWGLWDMCYRNPEDKNPWNRDKISGKITFSINEYKANLDSIVTIIKAITDAKLIFVTTTYVPENEPGRFQNDVVLYNDEAKEIMQKHSIAVNDIYAKSVDIHKRFGQGLDNVHYRKDGYKELSKLIADFIETKVEL